ncbi:Chromatin structure-remodeling complex subunit [Wickerhamomyces ciferrii]|uniref:Chromatin structure-remodeling complex subunit n=1 Tax=Wickerhamomyces ciferrii (strain ATCC 14091 / BCRC 22168 / CBS 111 / JCM 3599 / NBRC 0793 / NRRL Y-1031 F-60-10) TaxID=1206466 RepID=K0KW65_WICCF|nr:Chromatin structure-remodeling complex subunit [Wickerhamomyces ciferrii]CCH45383.1 Chromatin structure-remodeling complex subunit [Wickerhamomyces ciferrii]
MSNQILAQITPTPIVVPQTLQSFQQSNLNPYQQLNQNYYAHPGNNYQGSDLMTHLQLNIKAGVNLEWCSRTILQFSNSAPYLIKHQWVLDYLLNDLYDNFNKTSALSLRNLSQDGDFTQLLALDSRTKKILYEVLSQFKSDAPNNDYIFNRGNKFQNLDNELLSYTIDIVESLSSYIAPAPKDDDLFLTLIEIFQYSHERSLLISIMRSFARFLVRSELTLENCSNNLTSPILDKIVSFLLTNDYDLILTSLDFLYQFSLPGNLRINTLLKNSTRQEILKLKLPYLLTFQLNILGNPNDFKNLPTLRLIKRTKPPIPINPPILSPEHYQKIINLQEPSRATAWMRCSYKSVNDGEVTQISLWKAYEKQFEKETQQNKKKLLPAVDFIKNVSNAFPNSSAMVINLSNGQRKFIIKGIEPRYKSVDISTGQLEALNTVQTSSKIDQSSMIYDSNSDVKQEPLPIYHSPLQLNDVNKSSSLLLTSLTNNSIGKELFKPIEEEIFKKIEAVPLLADELIDLLKYLQ